MLPSEVKEAEACMIDILSCPRKIATWYDWRCTADEWWCKNACKYPEHITNSEEGIMWMSASESISRFMDKNLFDYNNMVVFACFSDDHHVRRCLHGMYGSRYIR